MKMILIPHLAPVNFLGNCFVNNFCICESLCFFFPLSKKMSVIDFLTGYSHSEPLWRSISQGSGLPQEGHGIFHPSTPGEGGGFLSQSQAKLALTFLHEGLPELRTGEVLTV